MTEDQSMKAMLVSALLLSNEVEEAEDRSERLRSLEELHSAIQSAAPMIRHYAADLMVP